MRARLLLLACALTLPGCVLQERFRYVQAQDSCFDPPPDPVPGVAGEHRPFRSVDCRTSKYTIAFIEFDEDGEHVDAAQAEKALRLIESEKARALARLRSDNSAATAGKVITLVYVHGWKNNADQVLPGRKPKDVERFSTALAELGARAEQASATTPVPIVGVYIAWKGKSLKGPGMFTWLSYWSRRNVGNRVGGPRLTAVLNRIIDSTVRSAADPSRVMLVGHSFGARVLEHAIENGVTLYDPEVRTAIPVRPRVDLVLYVNAAIDARLSLGRVLALRERPITVRHPDYTAAGCAGANATSRICKEYPLIVAITSRGDLATKYVQPIANTVNFDGKSAPMPALPTGPFFDAVPAAGRIRRSAPGHLRFLQSHDLTEVGCPVNPAHAVACEAADPTCAFAFRTRGAADACFKASTRPAGVTAPFNQTAFWIMDVDTRVVKDHGDIWNLSTLNMLGELMAPRGFFDPRAQPMTILATRP